MKMIYHQEVKSEQEETIAEKARLSLPKKPKKQNRNTIKNLDSKKISNTTYNQYC